MVRIGPLSESDTRSWSPSRSMPVTVCMNVKSAPNTQAWSYAAWASRRPLMPRGKPR